MRKCSLGIVLLVFSFLTVHFTCLEVFNFCPRISSAFSGQVVYADTDLSEKDQEKIKEYYKSARQYYKEGNYGRTLAECQKIVKIDTYNVLAHKLIKRAGERLKKEETKKIEQKNRAKERAEKEAQKQEKLEKKREERAQILLQREKEKELAAQQKAQELAALEAKRQAKRDIELKEAALKEQLRREDQIEEQAEKLKQKKLDELLGVAKDTYSDGRYDAAIAQCGEVLKIDAYNRSAQKLIAKSEKRIQIAKDKELAEKEKRAEQARSEEQKQAEKESKLKKEAQIRLQKQREKALEEQRRKEERIEKEAQKQAKLRKKKEAKELARQKEAEEKSAAKASKLAKQKAAEDAEKEAGLIALQKKKIKERKQTEREELENEIETHYRNGKKLYRNDEYSDAIKEFNAVLGLDSAHEGAKEYLTASEESLEEQNERESARQVKVAKKGIERKEELRKRDIQDRITDTKIKLDEGEYDEAIKMLEEILPDVLDENLRRSVELLVSKARTEKTVKEEELSQKKLRTISDEWMLDITKAQLPPAEAKRLKELERKKEKVDAARELRDKASSIKVPLVKYSGTDLRDVVLFLIKQTGINIVVDEAIFSGGSVAASTPAVPVAPQAEGGERVAVQLAPVVQSSGPINTKVTCFLQNMTLLSVLEAILRPKDLDYRFTKEYIWVSTRDRIQNQPLEDMETRVYSLEYGSSMNIKRLEESGFKTTAEEMTTGLGAAGEETGEAKVSGESVKELLETLVPQPTGASITVQSELNKLFVKNTPENLDKTEKILAELRTPVQVSIEARYVYVKLEEGEDIGIGFTDIYKHSEMGGKHGATEVKNAGGTVTEAEQYMTGGLHETHTINPATILSGITGLATTGLDMTYRAVLNEIQFTAVLKALQTRTDTNTLSAPKLTVLNNKPGIVKFISTINYIDTVKSKTTTTDSTPPVTTVTFDYTFTEKDVGMILNVTPQVNEATQCVTLFLQPVISEVESWRNYTISRPSTGLSTTIDRPDFYSKDIETYVTVHDGDTVVLGGFMEDATEKIVHKVPFLSDIPLLGKLFQYKRKGVMKRKLLIFVTVNILDASGNSRIAQ